MYNKFMANYTQLDFGIYIQLPKIEFTTIVKVLKCNTCNFNYYSNDFKFCKHCGGKVVLTESSKLHYDIFQKLYEDKLIDGNTCDLFNDNFRIIEETVFIKIIESSNLYHKGIFCNDNDTPNNYTINEMNYLYEQWKVLFEKILIFKH